MALKYLFLNAIPNIQKPPGQSQREEVREAYLGGGPRATKESMRTTINQIKNRVVEIQENIHFSI